MLASFPTVSLCPLQRYVGTSPFLALALILALVGAQPPDTAAAAASQCIACHTDAAKLKALTPPDPAPTEEGEG